MRAVAPPSLSLIATVPVAMVFPGLSVVDENAENVPKAAIAPAAPTPRRARSTVLVRVISVQLLEPLDEGMCPLPRQLSHLRPWRPLALRPRLTTGLPLLLVGRKFGFECAVF